MNMSNTTNDATSTPKTYNANHFSNPKSALPVEAEDWGKWIETNRNALLLGVLAIVLAVLVGGYFLGQKSKSQESYNAKIYTFEKSKLVDFQKDAKADVLVAGVKSLKAEVGNYIGLFPIILKSADALIEKGNKQEALEVLLIGKDLTSNDYAKYFVNSRLAVIYEDLGKNQESIDTLNTMNKSGVVVFEGKNYLDLGRLYLKLNDKEKAKASFQYVVDKAKDDAEFVKLAKLYLVNLK